MRVRRLELKAFGPFTDKYIDFTKQSQDMHVIYGPNEAGKSSVLRALRAWLYGFPERTLDNFIHSNDQLRVAGVLENANQELYFVRRKKRKASVLDLNGNSMDQEIIKSMLHGIDQDVFEKLFGLDHETLVQGGTDILQEKGTAGTTLFSAGTGIVSLQKILNELKAEKENIFKTKATKKPYLNAALRSFHQLKSEINNASLASSKWKEHDQAFRRAQKKLKEEQEKRSRINREYSRLNRIQQALKPLSLRRELLAEYEQLKHLPDLPDDFSTRRFSSQEQFRQAKHNYNTAQKRLQDFQEKAKNIKFNRELLDQAETIKDLHQRLGEYRKGMQDLPTLEGKRVQEKTTAGNIQRKIYPGLSLDEIYELRPLLRRRRGIEEIGSKLPVLEQKEQNAINSLKKLEKERQKISDRLAKLPDFGELQPLRQAIEQATRLGDIDSELDDISQELIQRQENFEHGLVQIGLWKGSASELLELSLPLDETVNRFAEAKRNLDEELRAVKKKRSELLQEQNRLNRNIRAIEKAGEVPTERELEEERARRDYGWKLLRRQWLDGEDVSIKASEYHSELKLPDAYEYNVQQVDIIADRLRREGERVHTYAQLQADLEKVEQELVRLDNEEASLNQQLEKHESRWQKAWEASGIEPLAPSEMVSWKSKIEQLRLQAQQIVDYQRKFQQMSAQRDVIVKDLNKILLQFQGQSFQEDNRQLSPVLGQAQNFLKYAEEKISESKNLQEQLEKIDEQIVQAREELEEVQTEIKKWNNQWSEILNELGLSGSERPSEIADFFEELQKCFDHLERAEEFQKRINGIQRDAERFISHVSDLVNRVSPELSELPVDQAVESLSGLLNRARKDEIEWKNCQEGIEKAKKEILEASNEMEAASIELDKLCQIAGCERYEDLEDVERFWQKRIQIEKRIEEEEERLRDIAEGLSIEELESQADQIDPNALPGEIQSCAEDLEQINQSISELDQIIGAERKELQNMDGSALAAQKAEEAEEKLTEIRRLSEHYIRLCIAIKVLEEEIERYKAENQDPVLALANSYFAELTLNSFDGLHTDIDDKGEQIIVGMRNGGERVTVEGMSSGTRDQLFLALRLASLEHRLKKSEPMPFTVDDILINFDESRSKAALRALARLSENNQVLVFTHHNQLYEMSNDLKIQVYNLE